MTIDNFLDDILDDSIEKMKDTQEYEDLTTQFSGLLLKALSDKISNNFVEAMIKYLDVMPEKILNDLAQNTLHNFTAYISGHTHEIATGIIKEAVANNDKFKQFQIRLGNKLDKVFESKMSSIIDQVVNSVKI